jgi:hypothetical protein
LLNDVYKNNDEQFMQSLANPEIGGFFDIVREGQGPVEGQDDHRARQGALQRDVHREVAPRVPGPTVSRAFDLEFRRTRRPSSRGTRRSRTSRSASTRRSGRCPSTWPRPKAEADANPIYPGGTFKVYGDFCWGGDKTRAEAYFIPTGTKPDPNAGRAGPELGEEGDAALISREHARRREGRERRRSRSSTSPTTTKLLDGTGDNAVARVVIYDNKAHRSSGHDAKSILTLKAKKPPLNVLLIAGSPSGLVVVIGLLVIVLDARRRRGGRAKAGQTPPAPGMAGGCLLPDMADRRQGMDGLPPAAGYGERAMGGPPPGGAGYGGYRRPGRIRCGARGRTGCLSRPERRLLGPGLEGGVVQVAARRAR